MSSLIISIHDVSPATAEESAWWLERLEVYGLHATLLVIPGPWRGAAISRRSPLSRKLLAWAEAGHEVSLHGWSHTEAGSGGLASRLIARGAGEFAALGSEAARRRLEMGLSVLESNNIPVTGFTPPGWLISPDASRQVRMTGLSYYTTHTAIHDLHRRRKLTVPVVCHRPRSPLARCAAAVVRAGYHLADFTGRDLRLAIHPDDTHVPLLVDATVRVIEAALEDGRNACSYRSYLDSA